MFFRKDKSREYAAGAEAIVVKKPVLFKAEDGEVGLMVKVTAYGTGRHDQAAGLPVERLGKDHRIWRAENFAYFVRNDYYKWQHGGWVY